MTAVDANTRADRAWALAGAGAVATSLVVALLRARSDGWYPVGDNAYFAIRARDVFTDHHPLLGTWTSASLSAGEDMNNPGPLLWDLLAVPARLDPVGGVSVGATLINLACLAALLAVARRSGGWRRATGVMAAAAALAWTMGSNLVVDPWQPHVLLLPFLLFLVLVWALADGDAWMLPAAAGVGSFLVQTHLTYAILVAVLGFAALVAWTVGAVRCGGDEVPRRRWRGVVRPVAVAGLVALVLWAQPLVEQVTADEGGNLGRVLGNTGSDESDRLGVEVALRMVADTGVVPPAWARPSFERAFAQERVALSDHLEMTGLVSGSATVVALGVLGAALLASALVAQRRGDRSALVGLATAAVGVAAAAVTAAVIPLGPSGFGLHQVRWLWPLGVFTAAAVVLALVARWSWSGPALAGVAVLLGVMSIPAYDQSAGPAVDAYAMGVMRDVGTQLDGIELDGPVLFAASDLRRMPIYEPYSTPMMLEMDRRGVGFVVDDPSQARQVGASRLHPERARSRIVLLVGDAAGAPPAGGTRLAHVEGLTRSEQSTLKRLRERIADAVRVARLRLTERGQALAAAGHLPGVEETGRVADAELMLNMRTLWFAGVDGSLVQDQPGRDLIERYVALQRRWDQETLSVWSVPLREPAEVIDG